MKMRGLFLLCLSASIFQLSYAQIEYAEWGKSKLSIGNKGFYIERVVDARKWNENLGIALNAEVGTAPIQFPDSLEKYLLEFLQKNIPQEPKAIPITLQVQELILNEKVVREGGVETIDWKCHFLKKDSLNQLQEIFESKLRIKTRFSYQFTSKRNHGKLISKTIDSSFRDFAESLLQVKNNKIQSAKVDTLAKNPLNTPKKGFYYNLQELVSNSPFEEVDYPSSFIKAKDSTRIVIESPNGRIFCDDYSYSDGKDVYLCASNYANGCHYTKVLQRGYYYYFEDKITSDNAVLVGGMLGGLSGALLAQLIKEKVGFVLNPRTGVITILNDKKAVLRLLYVEKDLYDKYRAIENPDLTVTKNYLKIVNKRRTLTK